MANPHPPPGGALAVVERTVLMDELLGGEILDCVVPVHVDFSLVLPDPFLAVSLGLVAQVLEVPRHFVSKSAHFVSTTPRW